MTQKLATRNSDAVPLDFGINIVFDADGMHAAGRADNPNYRGATFGHLTAADVTVSNVADDYAIPGATGPAAPSTHAEDALTFKRRFTTTERIAIRTAIAGGDHIMGDFMDLLDTGAAVNSPVRFNDRDVIAGLNYLETASVIAAGRAAQILTP